MRSLRELFSPLTREKNYGTKCKTILGEEVKSLHEKQIADYLYRNKIPYKYESEAKTDEWVFSRTISKPDFFLPTFNVYVEYWGLLDADNEKLRSKYESQKNWKTRQYRENGIRVISIYHSYLRDLDSNFRREFKRVTGLALPSPKNNESSPGRVLITCVKCKARTVSEAIYCPNCGSKIVRIPVQKPEGPRRVADNLGPKEREQRFRFRPSDKAVIEELEGVLNTELQSERKKVVKEKVKGTVVAITENLIDVQLDLPVFERWDYVAYLRKNGDVKDLGYVILAGKQKITIQLHERSSITELAVGGSFYFCRAEAVIEIEAQQEFIEQMKNGSLSGNALCAAEVMFHNTNRIPIIRRKIDALNHLRNDLILDDSQVEATESILGLLPGQLLLVIGPPGTGKTKVIATAAYALMKQGKRVLITSHTNRAVDNAMENLPVDVALRVGRPEKVLPKIRPYLLSSKMESNYGEKLIQYERSINRGLGDLDDSNSETEDGQVLDTSKSKESLARNVRERDSLVSQASRELVKESRIIGSTLIRSTLPPLTDEVFDYVLIDECSQATLTLALLGMAKAKSWVLIGDHKQLLPIFKSVKDKKTLETLCCFSYLLGRYEDRSLWLRNHYRSNSSIINFSAQYVYGGKIRPVEACDRILLELNREVDSLPWLKPSKPVVFLNVGGAEKFGENDSPYNLKEIRAVNQTASQLQTLGIKKDQIGIITPYREQRKLLKNEIGRRGPEIDTIDSFQGREKDVIIVSLVGTRYSSLRWISDANRLNVAFTRARKKLIVIGNNSAIGQSDLPSDNLLSKFCSYAKEIGGFYEWKDAEGGHLL